MGELRESGDHGDQWMLYDERTRYRNFLLIDESHNFRNTDTQRYRVLDQFIDGNDCPCVLLTATPRNKSIWDIYSQLKLFHDEERTDLPVDPPNLRAYFVVEEGKRRLPALLSHLLIRRTGNHILRWYGYDAETDQRVDPDHFAPYKSGQRRAYVKVGGRKQFFPKRKLVTVEYSIEAAYRGLYDRLQGFLGRRLEPGELTGAERADLRPLWAVELCAPELREAHPYSELTPRWCRTCAG